MRAKQTGNSPAGTITLLSSTPSMKQRVEQHIGASSMRHYTVHFQDPEIPIGPLVTRGQLFVIDWALKQPSSLGYINRLRKSDASLWPPILVVGDQLSLQELRIIKEFPIVEAWETSGALGTFDTVLSQLAVRSHSHEEELQNILKPIRSNSENHAPKSFIFSALHNTVEPVSLACRTARFLADRMELQDAQQLLNTVTDMHPESTFARTERAWNLLRLHQTESAYKELTTCQKSSRANIQRECLLGAIHLHALNPEKAEHHFRKAISLDSKHPVAQYASNLSIDLQLFLHKSSDREKTSFVVFLNRLGAYLVKQGQLERGCSHFRLSLHLVFAPDQRAIVMFNLALAYIRRDCLLEAYYWLRQANSQSKNGMAKARGYLKKISSHFVHQPGKLPPMMDDCWELVDDSKEEDEAVVIDESRDKDSPP